MPPKSLADVLSWEIKVIIKVQKWYWTGFFNENKLFIYIRILKVLLNLEEKKYF